MKHLRVSLHVLTCHVATATSSDICVCEWTINGTDITCRSQALIYTILFSGASSHIQLLVPEFSELKCLICMQKQNLKVPAFSGTEIIMALL